ncbi:hypothetical protein EIN_046400 [Entamoeba invadens IP1]|uniref:VWFA domain-containing protein n=2 Tax=Entamoeba invadens TaxID=33085 RepID=A0A0A1UG44_ENTIV|nr:hypothetical protein EIN_046400 [Entamoeba invadens IP1]ELP94397.1 hypothetical protein EIN_046400 [Entamoeba invadens IP1]BAN41531.1 hypothetical protein [Entamoeba invadens]|eukprot:XP_004261168.1 hypothetical protein EIN_046400 [Entamoeba invadens IP1]
MKSTVNNINKTQIKKGEKVGFELDLASINTNECVPDTTNYCTSCHGILTQKGFCQICRAPHTKKPIEMHHSVLLLKKSSEPVKETGRTVVFCLDNSGSMSGNRIEAMRSNIKRGIDAMVKSEPGNRVYVVTFESDCLIIGNDESKNKPVSSDLSFDSVVNCAKSYPDVPIISQVDEQMKEQVDKIDVGGRTAGLSGLLLAVVLAGRKHDGKVIFCTDGMSNKGIESTDENINKIIKLTRNVTVDVLYFRDCESFVGAYRTIANKTSGKVMSIDLKDSTQKMEFAVKTRTVGENAKLDIFTAQCAKQIKTMSFPKIYDSTPITFECEIDNVNTFNELNSFVVQAKLSFQAKAVDYIAVFEISVDITEFISEENTSVVISTSMNKIYQLNEQQKYDDAIIELKRLESFKFDVNQDELDQFKGLIPVLIEYFNNAKKGDISAKQNITSVLSYMKDMKASDIISSH